MPGARQTNGPTAHKWVAAPRVGGVCCGLRAALRKGCSVCAGSCGLHCTAYCKKNSDICDCWLFYSSTELSSLHKMQGNLHGRYCTVGFLKFKYPPYLLYINGHFQEGAPFKPLTRYRKAFRIQIPARGVMHEFVLKLAALNTYRYFRLRDCQYLSFVNSGESMLTVSFLARSRRSPYRF